MSIRSEIERIRNNVSDALTATSEMGADVPATASSNDLGSLIRSIPRSSGKEDLCVTMTPTESPDPEMIMFEADATYEQVFEAYALGRFVYARVPLEDVDVIVPIMMHQDGQIGFGAYTGDQFLMVIMGQDMGNFAIMQLFDMAEQLGIAEMNAQLAEKSNTGHSHNYYGVCTTAADVAAKTVSIDGFKLVEGAMVIVKFDNANSASNPTLNVSGTGAKPMYRYGTTVLSTGTTTTGWYAGSVQLFVYNGTGWVRDYWNNTTYSNASLGNGYATCSTAAATLAKTASLSSYSLSTGGCVSIKFTNAVPANATLNITSKGAKPIYYKGAAITDGIIKAGDTATFVYSTNYHLIAIDRDTYGKSDVDTALSGKAPSYTYGTTDLTAGSSSLATGVLYFVYE